MKLIVLLVILLTNLLSIPVVFAEFKTPPVSRSVVEELVKISDLVIVAEIRFEESQSSAVVLFVEKVLYENKPGLVTPGELIEFEMKKNTNNPTPWVSSDKKLNRRLFFMTKGSKQNAPWQLLSFRGVVQVSADKESLVTDVISSLTRNRR